MLAVILGVIVNKKAPVKNKDPLSLYRQVSEFVRKLCLFFTL
jgi:hypothetical protein